MSKIKYLPTIGIECHVQLNTVSKLFSGASNDSRNSEPNSNVSPLCYGMPGTLPVLNKKAVELSIKAGIALNAEIARTSRFERKHYFYPDLPKGYQITQFQQPIVGRGVLNLRLADGKVYPVGITRAHIEEDAGKLTHPDEEKYSLVDLNRAGTPLLEIVSEPDIHSAELAKAYTQELYMLMKYAGVTLGDLYHGNMRFDVNVSIAPVDSNVLGARAEVKNLNSFRSVERATLYEIGRQTDLLNSGQSIMQETRGWDESKQKTFSQRSKEDAHDYRYFPDADLPPIVLDDFEIEQINKKMPKLPIKIRKELSDLGIQYETAETLLLQGASFVNIPVEVGNISGKNAAQFAANYLVNRFIKQVSDVWDTPVPKPKHFVETYNLFHVGVISSNAVDKILPLLSKNDNSSDARTIAENLGLLQQNDDAELRNLVNSVLNHSNSAKALNDIQNGNDKAIGYLVGQVMKLSQGRANPALVSKLITELIRNR